MYCSKCGKEITDDSKFCEHCGFHINLDKDNKQVKKQSKAKIIIIVILIIVGVAGIIIAAISYMNYQNYQNELAMKNKIFDKIRQFDTSITWEELAQKYNCSIKDLTIQNLQNTLDKYEEDKKKYNEEQQEYDSKYKNQFKEAREKCKKMIGNEVFENSVYGMFNSNNNSSYRFTAKDNGKEIDSIGEINSENETIRRICMTIQYSCSIERFEVNIHTGNMSKYNESGTIIVQGELDLTTNKLSIYCIEGYNYYGNLIKQEGKPLNLIDRYAKPRIIRENNQNRYEWNENEIKDTSNITEVTPNEVKQENKISETTEIPENYNSSNFNINGTYTDRVSVINSEGAEYGHSYNVYIFKSGIVESTEDMTTYKGTYTIKGNKITITYTGAYDIEDPIPLDKFNEELTIKDENTLVTSNGTEYLKE